MFFPHICHNVQVLFACYMSISLFFWGGTKTLEYGRFLRRCPIVEWPCQRTPKTRDGRLGNALKGFSENNSRSTSKWSQRFAHFLQTLGKIICILLGKGNLLKWLSASFCCFLLSHIVCHRFQDPKCQDFVCWLVVSNIFIFTPI